MKIGIVCYPTYGGSGVIATELGKALSQEGHEIHFITYSQPTRLDFFNPNLYYHEVNVKSYPLFQYPPYELALTSKMVDVAINEKLDLLHVHYAVPHASAAYMARQILRTKGYDIPFITTLHGTDITVVGKDATNEPVVTFSINESNGVTAVSEDLKNDTYKHFKINRSIEVIPNFIDLERFKKQSKDHFKKAICPNDEKLVVHTSNFRKVKRVKDVLDVFCEMRKVVPSKLLLIGDGPERKRMEDKARGICTEDIRFLGKLEAVEEVLSVSDLFLMTSEKESFGLAALEAMACEVPVISTNAGGLPELNKNGYSGFVCEVGDVDGMVKKAIHMLDNDNLEKFKQGARERAAEFDVNMILRRYEDYYLSIIKEHKKSLTETL
ncbi:MAG: N-acetyl-alpha-D-glucosaminyl L-malate synthase BshA [Ekhidna sp.]|nr:N-acetyl-alpha-D-glucosaminyl L-malate synthase BshA [Ekhidna sp.]